jgi:type IX secretion system PorP/SprF family membrane protein
MSKKNTCIFILFLLAQLPMIGQLYPQQSMYMFNALGINPGSVGQQNALNVTLSHRTMWQGISGAPRTNYFTIHSPLKNEKLALGIQFYQDKIGVSSQNTIQATSAYRLKLGRNRISFGLTAGITSCTNMWSQVVTTDAVDQTFNSGDATYMMPSSGAGIYYESPLGFGGVSVPQFFTATYVGGNEYTGFQKIGNHSYHIMGGRRFIVNKNIQLQGSTLIKYHPTNKTQIDLTAMIHYQRIADIGFTIRPKDAVTILMRGRVNDQFKVAYSFDFLTSNLARYGGGTHELALTYTFIFNSNAPNTRFF